MLWQRQGIASLPATWHTGLEQVQVFRYQGIEKDTYFPVILTTQTQHTKKQNNATTQETQSISSQQGYSMVYRSLIESVSL